MFKRKNFILGCLVLSAIAAEAAPPPQTKGAVSRPQTKTVVSHPQTSNLTSAQPPKTTTVINRPVTRESGGKQTSDNIPIKQLQTKVTVPHPQTQVSVNRPSSNTSSEETKEAGGGKNLKDSSALQGQNTISSSSAPTSMSNFQMPKAKDFKAANLTKGEEGVGKPDDAEKNVVAASLQVPKTQETSAENLQEMVNKAASLNKNELGKKIESQINK